MKRINFGNNFTNPKKASENLFPKKKQPTVEKN